MCSLWLSRFLLTVAQLKADQQQFTPHKFFLNLKKVQTHLRIKKGSNQTQPPLFPPLPHTHPHTHEHTHTRHSMEARLGGSFSLFLLPAPSSVRGYSKDQTHNYIIQKGFTGLRRGESKGGVRGWVFFKGKGWINGINKAGSLCLSLAFSATLDIRVLLNVSLTAHEISRKYWESLLFFSLWISCHVIFTSSE